MTYFNSTHQVGQMLIEFNARAKAQDRAILDVFADLGALTPSQAWHAVSRYNWPLTSVRRSITTLTASGRLRKLEHKVTGYYGRPEHVWIINTPQE
jgi:hypothetical protein